MSYRIIAIFAAWLAAVGSAGAAQDYPGPGPVGPPVSDTACDNRSVLMRIMQRFAYAERKTWHRGFEIASIENARLSYHPYAEPGLVLRRYCVAESVMTNGDVHKLYYAIEFGQGFAGLGNYVDFCVLGLDPWRVHDGACRTVR